MDVTRPSVSPPPTQMPESTGARGPYVPCGSARVLGTLSLHPLGYLAQWEFSRGLWGRSGERPARARGTIWPGPAKAVAGGKFDW